jgi:uncharacterized damage-inducible protein DinB
VKRYNSSGKKLKADHGPKGDAHMATKAAQQETILTKLIGRWQASNHKLAVLAGEFPEKKYDYKPADGVRSCADVLRHVAFWNQYVADSLRGRKADDTANELSSSEYRTKARIIEALNKTTADTTAALNDRRGEIDPATAELVVSFIEHTCEHYGQLVVYARLMGIVPPSSRT